MKNCKKHFIVALIVLTIGQFLVPMTARAQVLEVGGSVGLSYYMGDINPQKPFCQSSLGWGAMARYYEGTRWAFRFAYSNLQLNCSDEASGYRPERGLSFKTNIHDFALLAEFNFFDYFTGSKRNGLSPYLFGGLGLSIKTASGSEVSIPFGTGLKYSLGQKFGVAIDWRWNFLLAHDLLADDDFIDGVKDEDIGNDWFGYLNFSLTYKFNLPSSSGCNKRERYKNFD